MTRRHKKTLARIIIAAAVLLCAILVPKHGYITPVLFLISYATIGYDVLWRALRNIFHGQIFDENFLMSIATVGAIIIGEYPESVAVMLFYQVGELFSSIAVNKSRKSIASLMDIRPDFANVITDGIEKCVSPEEVAIGSTIIVRPGEKIPLDGVVMDGNSGIDTSAISGESMPREAKPGDNVVSGCINLNGVLTVMTTKEFGESTVSKILDMVENASSKKARTQNFITKFARYYTPAVVAVAAAIAFVMPFVVRDVAFSDWVYRALIFLVVSCPCALVISIPLGFFGGIGGASKKGILIKGANYLESAANIKTVVFDKTGTLTKGVFEVVDIVSHNADEKELLMLAAYAQCHSHHPIALSLMNAYGKDIDVDSVSEYEQISGKGVCAMTKWGKVFCGNEKLMKDIGIDIEKDKSDLTIVYVAFKGEYKGRITIADAAKNEAAAALGELRRTGVEKTIMLTGDSTSAAAKVASELGIDEVYASLLPTDKVEIFEKILESKKKGSAVAFVGDGVNDAPVLARADIGIAMGMAGSDAAIEACDIVIMNDNLCKLTEAIKTGRKTMQIVRQNIIIALGVKLLVLILGAFGLSNMWEAVFADVGVAVIAILNSMRAMK